MRRDRFRTFAQSAVKQIGRDARRAEGVAIRLAADPFWVIGDRGEVKFIG